MGDSATSCMSDVEGAEAPVDGVIAVGGYMEGTKSESEPGASFNSAEEEESLLRGT